MGCLRRLTMTAFSSTMLFEPRMMGPPTARIVQRGWRTVPARKPSASARRRHGDALTDGRGGGRTRADGDVASQVAVCDDDGARADLERVLAARRSEGRGRRVSEGAGRVEGGLSGECEAHMSLLDMLRTSPAGLPLRERGQERHARGELPLVRVHRPRSSRTACSSVAPVAHCTTRLFRRSNRPQVPPPSRNRPRRSSSASPPSSSPLVSSLLY